MMTVAIPTFIALGWLLQGFDSRVQRANDCISRQSAKITSLSEEKKDALRELRQGLYCSECRRTQSELERAGINFGKHLRDVKGTAMPASPSEVKAKSREFDQEIASAQRQLDSCEEQKRHAIADLQRQEDERRVQQQREREEALQRERERRQREQERLQEQRRKQDEERTQKARDLIEHHRESNRRLQETMEGAKNTLLDQLRRDAEEAREEREDRERHEAERVERRREERAEERKERARQESEDRPERELSLDEFHRKTLERLKENREFFRANPDYTGPPPGAPIPTPPVAAPPVPATPPGGEPRRFRFDLSGFARAERIRDAELPRTDSPTRVEAKDVVRATADRVLEHLTDGESLDVGEAAYQGVLSTLGSSLMERTIDRALDWAKSQPLFGGRSYTDFSSEDRREFESGVWLFTFAKRLLARDLSGAVDAHESFQERTLESLDWLLGPGR